MIMKISVLFSPPLPLCPMNFEEVKTPAQAKRWLLLPLKIYKDDPNWIRPLDKDIEEVFDPEKNKFIKRSGAFSRWLLTDDAGDDMIVTMAQ